MHAQFLGVPTVLGIPGSSSDEGPAALRRTGLISALQRVLNVTDLGDMPAESFHAEDGVDWLLHRVIAAANRQADAFTNVFTSDSLPITAGGDHTTSLGTALALTRLGLNFDVVWLDAHGDFNTPHTSPSGNPHGMVLALLAGLTPYLPQTVPPWRLHLWGVRDLDAGERFLLEALNVEIKDVTEMRAEWPALVERLSENVLISFDCDCCEPAVAPGTMTPVDDGFERAEALNLVRQISRSRRVVALDVVELHPRRDRKNRTARLAHDVVMTVARTQARSRRLDGHFYKSNPA